jgi:DNA-binding PadR family transcriptional regulator
MSLIILRGGFFVLIKEIIILGSLNEIGAQANSNEIIRRVRCISNDISDAYIYRALKILKEKALISGTLEKYGTVGERTVYCITEKGKQEFKASLKAFITQSRVISDHFINIFTIEEQRELLKQRIDSP